MAWGACTAGEAGVHQSHTGMQAALRHTFADLDLAWPGGESSRTAMARGRAAVAMVVLLLSQFNE